MRFRERGKGIHFGQAAIIAACLALFFALVVPLQTYIANRSMFDFGWGSVVAEALPVAVGLFLVTFAVLILSEFVIGRFLFVVALAIFLAEYFEVGFFSIGLPSLDGDMRAFANPFRKLIDTGLLVFLAAIVLAAYRWIKGYTHLISLGVLVLTLASLLDVRPAERTNVQSGLSADLCPQYDVVKSARFSPKRNVIMLILDTFRASMATDAVSACPELKQHFTGFVAYENNLSMHENTFRALPGLMTGRYLTPDMSANDYAVSIFGPDSFISKYADAGCSVFFSDQLLPYGYTNRRAGDFTRIADVMKKDGSVFLQNSNGHPYLTLLDVVRFRLAPYRYKCEFLRRAYARAVAKVPHHVNEVYREDTLYPILSEAPVDEEAKKSLLVFHTTGPHGPISRDRYGKMLSAPTEDIGAYNEYCIYVLQQVAHFLDKLKKRGLYDSSMIVLAADHGLIDPPSLKRMSENPSLLLPHGAESSILWVKPVGANDSYTTSRVPTSNCMVADLMRAAAVKDISQSEVAAILHTTDRRFVAKYGSTWYSMGRYVNFSEWRYDDDGHVVSLENKGIWKAN